MFWSCPTLYISYYTVTDFMLIVPLKSKTKRCFSKDWRYVLLIFVSPAPNRMPSLQKKKKAIQIHKWFTALKKWLHNLRRLQKRTSTKIQYKIIYKYSVYFYNKKPVLFLELLRRNQGQTSDHSAYWLARFTQLSSVPARCISPLF